MWQVEDLVGAMRFGPLSEDAFARAKKIMQQSLQPPSITSLIRESGDMALNCEV